jgi:hypothetical protein
MPCPRTKRNPKKEKNKNEIPWNLEKIFLPDKLGLPPNIPTTGMAPWHKPETVV